MDKILIILTGGTIGSFTENGIIDVSRASSYRIISRYYEKYGRDMEFDVLCPVNILSENMNCDTWLDICRCIDSVDTHKYRGIIICHGSDTLSYTSAFIGLIYNGLNIPVVLTASNYELEDKRSNGLCNLRKAVLFINKNINGVFTVYEDIYIATRIAEAEPYNDSFRDFSGKCWAHINENEFYINGGPSISEINEHKCVINKCPLNLEKRVMLIRPYPGMNYENINLDGVSAVVHYMYHSATACVKGGSTSILGFAERCSENNVKLYCASFKNENALYRSAGEIIEKGIIPLYNISAEAAYAKVIIAENTDADINKCWYFENLQSKKRVEK